jgi:methionyl-tRNA synthetase
VLWVTAETVRRVAILCQPYIPGSAGKLLDTLAVPEDRRQFERLAAEHALKPGTALPAPQPVFPRYVEKTEADA